MIATMGRAAQAEPETWAAFRLIAAVYRRAIRDAERGDREAVNWLDTTLPDWRKANDRLVSK